MTTRVRAKIVGRVQGVGFRPTVYRYATQLGLRGYVCNGPHGVTLEVEGEERKVGAFFDHLTNQPPRQAVIEDIQTEVLSAKGYRRFEVAESEPAGEVGVHIAPDLATCDDCLQELHDPGDRRFGYPFINCTNCGPRFTIIRDLPYDRDKTSMAAFEMCGPCDHEYRDPSDRRFHAQPDACPVCGPRLQLRGVETDAPLARAVALLRQGRIVAIKSLGGYQLACDATSQEAVVRLRLRKRRTGKPFAVMFRDVTTARKHCHMNEAEEAELLSVARPIVLLKVKSSPALVQAIAPDTGTLGVFLPYTPLHHLLLQEFDALVMTSANLADEPIISDESELPVILGAMADAALTHDRPIVHKCDDSVLRVVNGQRQLFRRGRGFVPNPIRIADESPQILAVGGELKNTFCLVRNGNAFLSQHIGDLKDYWTYEYFRREVESWKTLMRIEPVVVAHDMHPAYLSTKWAEEWKNGRMEGAQSSSLPAFHSFAVQHHHAHIASVMSEHDLHAPIIGVALDGTGYGTDGTSWGGEILVADRADFERVAHFKTYRLPGGDKAVAEPWRMAASVLHAEGLSEVTERTAPIHQMIDAGFNSPVTSSAGRLFDAVAALLGLCDTASYEAQAAIRLEAVADAQVKDVYLFEVRAHEQPWTLDFGPAVRQIVADRRHGVAVSEIAAMFHNTVAAGIIAACRRVRSERDINEVALSGGVFQNELLLRRTADGLRASRFAVFANAQVPPNDGGLALGQAAVAAERMRQPCV